MDCRMYNANAALLYPMATINTVTDIMVHNSVADLTQLRQEVWGDTAPTRVEKVLQFENIFLLGFYMFKQLFNANSNYHKYLICFFWKERSEG